MRSFLFRHGGAIAGAALCTGAIFVTLSLGGFDRPVRSADVLSGKWSGRVVWSAASGREFSRALPISLTFQPDHTVWTIFSLPSGALGGTGSYILRDGHLTIHCNGLRINGRPLPPTLFTHQPWFHGTADYAATFDGTALTLTAAGSPAGPVPAPAYPLLVSEKPIVLTRTEALPEPAEPSAPRE